MNDFLKTLSKPAKWILVIVGLIYAVWFAIGQANAIHGSFMSVSTHIIILLIGTALLLSAPVLVLVGKNEQAKIAFLVLVGYWLISSILSWFATAEISVHENADALDIVGGIFAFIAGLCLVGILVLIVLEYALKNSGLRTFAFFALLGVILFASITGIFYLIEAIKNDYGWYPITNGVVEYIIVPVLVCFGYLYFFGAPAVKKGSK